MWKRFVMKIKKDVTFSNCLQPISRFFLITSDILQNPASSHFNTIISRSRSIANIPCVRIIQRCKTSTERNIGKLPSEQQYENLAAAYSLWKLLMKKTGHRNITGWINDNVICQLSPSKLYMKSYCFTRIEQSITIAANSHLIKNMSCSIIRPLQKAI